MGAAPTGPAAGPVDPNLGIGAAPAATDPGILGMTGGSPDGVSDEGPMLGDTEPGEKKPWGSICPVCGADDVNISESNADCQSCGTTYKILQSIELISLGEKGKDGAEETGEDLMSGLGEMNAPAETPMPGAEGGMGAPPAPAPGMAPVANFKSMFRLATTVDSDVYLRTAMPDFDRATEKRLPVGMICPSCGSREAHKVSNNTFCYECGNYSKTTVASNKKNPSKLDVTITWID